jgi:hypothetical protein
LLDLVGALDMPELPDWEALCAAYEIMAPPRLMLEAAQELNEAYAAEQPLQTLLSKHRTLALARAPMSERIAVMRELAVQDPAGGFWDEDIRTYETALIKELHSEATAAVRAKALGRVQRVRSQLEALDWRIDVPTDLRTDLSRAYEGLLQAEGVVQLRALLPKLDAAFSAMSYDEAAAAASEWQRIVKEHGVRLPTDLRELAEPALQWVAAQEARRATEHRLKVDCFNLTQAIEEGAPLPELEKLHASAIAHGLSVPDEVEAKYVHAVEARQLARRRRNRMRAAIAAALVVVTGAAVSYLTYQSIQSRHARTLVAQIDAELARGQIEKAEDAWRQVSKDAPALTSRPELAAVYKRIEAARTDETARQASFQHTMAAARAASTPDEAWQQLTAAEKLVRTNSERLEVLDLKPKVSAALHATQQERYEKHRGVLDSFIRDVSRIEAALKAGQLNESKELLRAAESVASELAIARDLAEEHKRILGVGRGRLEAAKKEYDLRAAEATGLERIVKASTSATALSSALKDFAAAVPNSPKAKSFVQSGSAVDAWVAAEQWYKLTAAWAERPLPSTPEELDERVQTIAAHLSEFPKTPARAMATDYTKILQRIQKALALDGPWKGDLRSIVMSPLVQSLNSLRTRDGRTYYFVGAATKDAIGLSISAVLTNDVKQVKARTFRPEQIAIEPGRSPQAKLSDTIRDRISKLTVASAQTFGLDAAGLVRADAELDPVLRVILLARILRLAGDAGEANPEKLAPVMKALESTNAEEIAWMNPDDPAAMIGRDGARTILKELPDLRKLGDAVASREATTIKLVRLRPAAKGVLLHEPNGPQIRLTAAPPAEGNYAIMATVDRGGGHSLTQIGRVHRGAVTLDEPAAAVSDGSMVFLCAEARQ